ncbi:MAG: DUF115 domain-containing protein [Geminocystis sp.]|nr:DUF115 domain-containing protein [Geminocystis sp.]MCS7149097.1 DUF115 domain-containing protein [Geminocystis sp.]MDW8463836.1 DUF115 domain-containing protein [Geminocystis sp.]
MKFTEDQIKQLFIKNSAILRKKAPYLWQIASSGEKGCEVKVDGEGRINAILRGNPVYKTDALQLSLSQVEAFEAKPVRLFADPENIGREINPQIIAHRYSFELLERLPNKISPPSCRKTKHIPLLLMVGLGFGLHLKLLLERYEIQNLIILDVPVFFRLSLYTLDWEWLLEHYSQPGRSLNVIVHNKLVLEKDLDIAFAELRSAIGQLNPGLFYWGYYFEHIHHSPPMKVREWFGQSPLFFEFFMGYFDDELWSLKWTLEKFPKKIPLYYPHKRVSGGAVAFVLGAGPSLDYALDKIRKYQDKAVIFSCGSTISSLERAGIVPDFHVEIERTKYTYDTLVEISGDFLRQIILIADNPLWTDCFDLFKKGYMFLKLNDTGAFLLEPTGSPFIWYIGPTVTAAGVALAAEFGFDTIFLFGVDLGTRNPQQHHSHLSNYYNPKSMLHKQKVDFPLTAPGNFGGVVHTNLLFAKTKYAIERVIKKKGVRVYNTSDGVMIEGAKPLPIEFFRVEGDFDKQSAIETIEGNFDTTYIDLVNPAEVLEKLYSDFETLAQEVGEYAKKFDGTKLYDVIHGIRVLGGDISSKKNTLLYNLLFHNVYSWSRLALGYALSLEDKERGEFMGFFWDMCHRFIEEAKGEIKKVVEEFGK